MVDDLIAGWKQGVKMRHNLRSIGQIKANKLITTGSLNHIDAWYAGVVGGTRLVGIEGVLRRKVLIEVVVAKRIQRGNRGASRIETAIGQRVITVEFSHTVTVVENPTI